MLYGLKRVDADAVALHDFAHALFHCLKSHKPAEFRDLLADEYVFDGVHGGNQIVFLIDDLDAQFAGKRRRKGVVSLAVDYDRAGSGRVGAGKYFHQRGFARAVFAHKAMHLAGKNVEGHVRERAYARKFLDDRAHFNDRGFVSLHLHRSSLPCGGGEGDVLRNTGAHRCMVSDYAPYTYS